MKDVAAVLLNYNSGALCVSAVESLLDQRFSAEDGGPGSLQLLVVDNASPEDQHEHLDPLTELGVELVYHGRNDGYSGGMNLGMSLVDARYVLIANPDVLVLPEALERMLALLRSDASVGMVGPRGFLDPGRFLLLPPNDLPTLSLHIQSSLGRVYQKIARRVAHDRSRRFLKGWLAEGPFEIDMISGFGMFLPTDLARKLGPFDEQYPFYFEDADLCRRLRRMGRRILIEPRAHMVHYYDQSARSVRAEVSRKYEVSQAYYYRKHYGRMGSWLFRRFGEYAAARAGRAEGWGFSKFDDLGEADRPVCVELPAKRDFVLEITSDPAFLFCGGHCATGLEITIGRSAWAMLDRGRWFARLLDRNDLTLIRAVTFEKTTPADGPTSWADLRAEAAAEGSS
ncbi:MAG: glycosyltransferase family 2 protein [Planctomycetota bacterium]